MHWSIAVYPLHRCIGDGGAGASFIHLSIVRKYNMHMSKLESPVKVSSFKGAPIAAITTESQFSLEYAGTRFVVLAYILPVCKFDVILGFDWLKRFNPLIDWEDGSGLFRPPNKTSANTPVIPLLPLNIVPPRIEINELPQFYSDFADVFSKKNDEILSPHRPYDCTIDLRPNTTPPFGPIYQLSKRETEGLREYINENLEKRIHPTF
jgi:hypothetical protein